MLVSAMGKPFGLGPGSATGLAHAPRTASATIGVTFMFGLVRRVRILRSVPPRFPSKTPGDIGNCGDNTAADQHLLSVLERVFAQHDAIGETIAVAETCVDFTARRDAFVR